MDKKLDLSKPVQTRDGRKVILYTTTALIRDRPLVGEVYYDDERDVLLHWWDADGRACHPSLDLVNAPEPPLVGYVNVYPPDKYGYAYASGLYATREEANKGATDKRVSCVRVESPIGRFDD